VQPGVEVLSDSFGQLQVIHKRASRRSMAISPKPTSGP
jgi:hypothetical protein